MGLPRKGEKIWGEALGTLKNSQKMEINANLTLLQLDMQIISYPQLTANISKWPNFWANIREIIHDL